MVVTNAVALCLALSRLSPTYVLLLLPTNLNKQTGSSSNLANLTIVGPNSVWVLDTAKEKKSNA
jgi:hypothetical protein